MKKKNFTLSSPVIQKLKNLAEEMDISQSEVVRMALREFLDDRL